MTSSDEKSSMGIWGHFRLSFGAGILVSGPFLLTGWLLVKLFGFVDGVIKILPRSLQPDVLFGYDIPGLGILLSVLFVYLSGLATRMYAGRQVVQFYEGLLKKVPIINGIYQSIKQLMTTLFSKKAAHFRNVVLVEYPRRGIFCFAFLTNDTPYLKINDQEMLSIFLPSTPNPTTGFYLLLPKEEIWQVDLSVEEAFKSIMSAGIVTPELLRTATRLKTDQETIPSSFNETKQSEPTIT